MSVVRNNPPRKAVVLKIWNIFKPACYFQFCFEGNVNMNVDNIYSVGVCMVWLSAFTQCLYGLTMYSQNLLSICMLSASAVTQSETDESSKVPQNKGDRTLLMYIIYIYFLVIIFVVVAKAVKPKGLISFWWTDTSRHGEHKSDDESAESHAKDRVDEGASLPQDNVFTWLTHFT